MDQTSAHEPHHRPAPSNTGRNVTWFSLDERMAEHLRLAIGDREVLADGLMVHDREQGSFRLRYTVRCDPEWQVRSVEVRDLDDPARSLVLHSDGRGNWSNDRGEAVPSLDGCHDLDIASSPFTNTLTIRRLALKVGESSETSTTYVTIPDLTAIPVRQRYTLLKRTPNGALYRYEAVESGFSADLPVDSDGLVIEYPQFFRRAAGEPRPGQEVFRLLAAAQPADEHRARLMLYGQLVGSWDVEATWYQQGEVSRTARGEWHFGWILGGRGVQDVLLRAGAPPQEYGTSIRCYDPTSDIWHITWMQPASGEYANLIGRQVGDGIVQEMVAPSAQQRERWSFTDITPNSFRWLGEVSDDGGTTWTIEQELRARRRA